MGQNGPIGRRWLLLGRRKTASVREAAPGKEARAANGGGGRAVARVRAAAPGCGREVGEGSGQAPGGALPPQPPPQPRGHVVWCVGRGEEEEGAQPSEETERHHTHSAQDGRRGSSTPSCQAAGRGGRAPEAGGRPRPAAPGPGSRPAGRG